MVSGTTSEPTGWRRLLSESRRPTRWDAVATAATLVTMTAATVLRTSEPTAPGTARLVFLVLAWLPLLVRTYWPEPVLAVVLAVEAGQLVVMRDLGAGLVGGLAVAAYQPVPVATMLAVYTVASRRRQRDGWVTGAVSAVVLLVAALLFQGISLVGTDVVMTELVLIAAAVGVGVRTRQDARARRAREAREQSRQAVLEERLRIARELHDTLAHDLALVDAQAGVADYLLDLDPPAARRALRDITQHTSTAIDDLRATLVLLRQDLDETDRPADAADPDPRAAGDPTRDRTLPPVPGLDRLDGLLDRFRDAGTPVSLDTVGEPAALGHHSDLAAYRIIQEALTNATKHAPGAPVSLTLRWAPRHLGVEIHNPPAAQPAGTRSVGTGHGLIGLRERARAAHGTFDAGPTHDGGYRVAAELPIRANHTAGGSAVPGPDAAGPQTTGPQTTGPQTEEPQP
ncbi:sensor histidine kinase [Frankia sp. AgB1.9]|nr:sensor histidine kinase [Frankia sp. AgB1.9]